MTDNLVICIAREFGSGGHDIGASLAKELNIAFYDKDLLKQAAEKSGIMEELFEKNDEKAAGSILTAFPANGEIKAASYADYIGYMPNDRMQNTIAEVIREVAKKEPCVIIGRCADYILRGWPKCFSVFIHADLKYRVPRVARMHNLDEDAARALIRKTDRSRANYYSYYTDREWAVVNSYDISLDASRLGEAKAVQLIRCAATLFAEA